MSVSELARKEAEGVSSNFTEVPRDWVDACEEARLAGYTTPMEWALAEFEKAVARKLGRGPNIGKEFVPGSDLAWLRGNLCGEEGCEAEDACKFGESRADVVKETTDMDYVSIGTKLAFGIPYWESFWRVHENNMRKIEEGTVREDGKLIKSPYHPKVNLEDL